MQLDTHAVWGISPPLLPQLFIDSSFICKSVPQLQVPFIKLHNILRPSFVYMIENIFRSFIPFICWSVGFESSTTSSFRSWRVLKWTVSCAMRSSPNPFLEAFIKPAPSQDSQSGQRRQFTESQIRRTCGIEWNVNRATGSSRRWSCNLEYVASPVAEPVICIFKSPLQAHKPTLCHRRSG